MTSALSSADSGQAPVVRRKSSAGLTWTSVALSAVLVVASVGSADSKRVIAQLQSVDTRWLWVAFAINVVQLALLGLRWSRVASMLGFRLSWVKATTEYALSTLTNQVLPSGVAGDGLRALRHAKSSDRSLLSVLEALALDRLSGQIGVWLIVLAGAPLIIRAGIIDLHRLELGTVLLVGLALVLWQIGARWRHSRAPVLRTQQWLRKAAECLLSPRNAAVHLPLSLLLVACSLLQLYVASRALGLELPLLHLFWLGPLILVASTVPSFFGGWGIREGASALLFGAAGLSQSTGVAVSMVYGTFALVSSVPGLLVVLFDSERTGHDKVKAWTYANALSMLVATAFVLWLAYPPLLAFVAALCFFFLVAQARGAWTPTGNFGLPNLVTTLRLVVTMGMLLGFAREPGWVLAAVALFNLLLDVLDGWLARRSALDSEFGARYDIEADALLVMTLAVLLCHRGLAGPWVILAGAWRYLYVLAPLVFPTPLGEARRSRHGRFAYVLMITCFMLALALPRGTGTALSLLGTLAVSLSFSHSFWERYVPARAARTGDIEA
jgi:uncharacterized membrane protein YbhN (UPF0104 family)/phosphatidylglycerophosphate synthase